MLEHSQKNLISPFADFLLVGGLSFMTIPWLYFFPPPPFYIYLAAFYLTFVVNEPHFIHSYQLHYHGFFKKISSTQYSKFKWLYLWSGILAPLLLLTALTSGFLLKKIFLHFLFSITLFLVGWHYVKQCYGVLMILTTAKGFSFTPTEKGLLKLNAYVLWIYAYLRLNQVRGDQFLYGIQYYAIDTPPWLLNTGAVALVATSLTTIFVFCKFQQRHSTLPINGMVGYFSGYLWLLLRSGYSPDLFLIPMFHSLQYLPFAWHHKSSLEKNKSKKFSLIRFFVIAMGIGALTFYFIPRWVTKYFGDQLQLGLFAFFASFIFINLHHYVMDNVIWRTDNPYGPPPSVVQTKPETVHSQVT